MVSLSHKVISGTSQFDDYVEAAASTTRVAYSCANLETSNEIARLDLNTPSPMRAPGEAPGNFVIESGIDELACKVGVDPLEIRLRNHEETDEDRGTPFSSKSLLECYAIASEQFGWKNRPRTARSIKEGDLYFGWGMASANFTVKLSALLRRAFKFHDDGRATVLTASHDTGTGTYTVACTTGGDGASNPSHSNRSRAGRYGTAECARFSRFSKLRICWFSGGDCGTPSDSSHPGTRRYSTRLSPVRR